MDLRTSCARIGDRPFLDPPEKHIYRFQIKKLEAFWYLLQVGLPKNVFNSISPNMDLQTSCTQVFNCEIYSWIQDTIYAHGVEEALPWMLDTLRGVEGVHGLFLFPLVLGKM